MFHPTPREAQMIEAIAEALADTRDGFNHFDPSRFANALRSLARGGGEEKKEYLMGWDEGIKGSEKTCKVYGNKQDDGTITITRVEWADADQPIRSSPAQVDEKRDEEIVEMFKSGGKLEYVDDKPEREMPSDGKKYLYIDVGLVKAFVISEELWFGSSVDELRWKNGRAFLLSETALAEKKCAELNEILRR